MFNSAFNSATLSRGRTYQRAGRAVVLSTTGGNEVFGVVSGTRRAPYQVQADIVRRRRRVEVRGTCSCPVGYNCKHVAALLLQAEAEGLLADLDDGPSNSTPDFFDTERHNKPAPNEELSAELSGWLRSLKSAIVDRRETYPPEIKQRLLYVLSQTTTATGFTDTEVQVLSARLSKDGSYSHRTSRYNPSNINNASIARFIRPSDHSILRRLLSMPSGYAYGGAVRLSGRDGAELLSAMIATGRCHFESVAGPMLRTGDPVAGRIGWTMLDDGGQRPTLSLDEIRDEGWPVIVPLVPPHYIVPSAWNDPDTPGSLDCGPVETGLPDEAAAVFLQAPVVPPDAAARFKENLANTLADLPVGPDDPSPGTATGESLPAGPPEDPPSGSPRGHHGVQDFILPATPPTPSEIDTTPTPCLAFRMEHDRYLGTTRRDGRRIVVARLTFDYDGFEISAGDLRDRPIVTHGSELVAIKRHDGIEFDAVARMGLSGLVPFQSSWDPQRQGDPMDANGDMVAHADGEDPLEIWIDLIGIEVPLLRQEGWRISIPGDFPLRVLHEDDVEIEAAVTGGSGMDWFELSLGIPVDGERVDIVPALLKILSRVPSESMETLFSDETMDEDPISLTLPDGRSLVLPFGRVRPILLALSRLFAEPVTQGQTLRLSVADAADLSRFEEAAGTLAWTGDDRLRRIGTLLRTNKGLPRVALPPTFAGTLREYQQAGLDWIQLLRDIGLGGFLADDMGLGKTIQALAHISVEKAEGRLTAPVLLVVPTSLVGNWRNEAAAFAGALSVLILQGPERKALFDSIGDHDLVITTYPLLRFDGEILTSRSWSLLILDEAQAVKNPATKAGKILRRIEAGHRLALTGTPLENNLGELWSLFDIISPGFLGTRQAFTRQWRTPIEKKGDREKQERLSTRLRPFLLRRTKADVMAELPGKTEIEEKIALNDAQRALYESVRLSMHKKVRDAVARKGLARSRIEFLDALLKLRQICCDPRLIKGAVGGRKAKPTGSAKLERLLEMVPEMVAEGRRILLFSQFTSMLDLIAPELDAQGIPFVTLTGKTRDRTTPVEQFQSDTAPIFLISLKAGGTGLNLTAADTVIHYDPWWNPAVEAQATDRAHRIGQDKAVFVYKLIAEETIERKMLSLQSGKRALAEGLFDPDGKTAVDITEDDIEYLLGPE